MKDRVRWFNKHLGYGFIRCSDGRDVFFHYSDLPEKEGEETKSVKKGQLVSYKIKVRNQGYRATDIKLL